MTQEFDVVCLGGGVAGEAIAGGLQNSGLTLAVVERELVGGECPYWGCVPSKTLLRSGETLSEADRARLLAASRVDWTVDFPKVSKRVLSMARGLDDSRPAAAMEATGARLFRGEGRLTDIRTVTVGREQLVARRAVVIANGSTAAIPPIPGLDTIDFWTNRQAAIPRELPASLAILGGGAIGVELGQAFARLGSKVTVIEAGPTFLGFEEPEAGAALRPHLEADGMTLMIGDPCVAVENQSDGTSRQRSAVAVHLKSGAIVSADRLLVATGRRANAEAWREAGIPQTERGWLKVDPATLEARPGVFGAGDVTGLGGFTHLAQPSTGCLAQASKSSPRKRLCNTWRNPDPLPPDTEVTMSTQTMNDDATKIRNATTVDLKLEVVVIPVADVDRAKRFYEGLGWRLDADFSYADEWRLVQLTPPGSPCSIMIGKGFTPALPGSVQGTFIVVDDLDAARAQLIGRGVDVSEAFHFEGDLLNARSNGHTPGRDPQGRSYFSFASFNDPDGNGWLLQEVTTRFPGRGFSSVDVATMRELLREAEARHSEYEPTAPKHQWPEWYAEYIVARERGKSPDEAANHAALQIDRTGDQVRT